MHCGKPQPDSSNASEASDHAGGAHHTVFLPSHALTLDDMRQFAGAAADIELAVIDNETRLPSLQKTRCAGTKFYTLQNVNHGNARWRREFCPAYTAVLLGQSMKAPPARNNARSALKQQVLKLTRPCRKQSSSPSPGATSAPSIANAVCWWIKPSGVDYSAMGADDMVVSES